MGLTIIRKPEPTPVVTKKSGFSFAQWYEKNKARLSEKRAKRYREDPVYRAAALKRGRAQRKKKPTPVTDGYTVSIQDAAHDVGVTVWTLREWRKKNYFPEPKHRDGRLWFTAAQVAALMKLEAFFHVHGSRVTAAKKPLLDDVVSLVFANW